MNAKTKLYDAPTAELVVVRMESNIMSDRTANAPNNMSLEDWSSEGWD